MASADDVVRGHSGLSMENGRLDRRHLKRATAWLVGHAGVLQRVRHHGSQRPHVHAASRSTNTIVLSRGVWKRRFAADRALIGSMLNVNMINLSRVGATPHLVLGVVPVDVHFPPLTADFNRGAVTGMVVGRVEDQVDFWLPLFLGEDPRRDDRTLDVVAKLRPGVTPDCRSGRWIGCHDRDGASPVGDAF